MFYEFFENAAHEEPGNVEDDGSGQREKYERAALVLVVDLLGEKEKDSEVRRTKSGEVGNHPRNQKACPPSPQAEEGDQVEEHEDANGEQLQALESRVTMIPSFSFSIFAIISTIELLLVQQSIEFPETSGPIALRMAKMSKTMRVLKRK